ncbi:hypothetical protein B9479_001548 [Cryptococcus floricola]|uniref:Retrotransposon gag domain-containing protein n=1 Tax=Cryptococcus floricola TaxID=2591691 RepID=A0A5D3B4D2_9TREE|nr:hypothetical protein B9479_001548 [Cryptococcus floricola]
MPPKQTRSQGSAANPTADPSFRAAAKNHFRTDRERRDRLLDWESLRMGSKSVLEYNHRFLALAAALDYDIDSAPSIDKYRSGLSPAVARWVQVGLRASGPLPGLEVAELAHQVYLDHDLDQPPLRGHATSFADPDPRPEGAKGPLTPAEREWRKRNGRY